MAINEEARIPVYLNDEQAKAALKNLQAEADKWRKKMHEAMAGGDMKGMKEAEKEMKKAQQAANQLKKETFDVNKVLENLSTASVKDLHKTLSLLKREQNELNRGTKEYADIQKKIDSVRGEFKKISGEVTEQKSALDKLKDTAAGLLPAFSFAAIGAGVLKMAEGVKNSTDDLSTQWDIFMGGLNAATNEFFRTIATGDWSNFTTNMREAVELGREYQRVLDELESKQRALSLAEADVRKEIVETEDAARNRSLTDEERMKAAERRIEIEDELAAKRTKIATETYEMEEKITMQQTRLSKERLMEVLKDMDSETKAKASAYNDQVARLKEIEKTDKALKRQGVQSTMLESEEYKNLQTQISQATEATIIYAEALAGTGKTTDEQLDKMVKAYAGMKEAEVSSLENTSRVRRQMYSIMSQEQDENDRNAVKAAKDREEKILKALDSAYKERQAIITSQYVNHEFTDKEYKAKLWTAEVAYLQQKKALLEQMGKDTADVELQLINTRLETINKTYDELKTKSDEFQKLFDTSMKQEDKKADGALTNSINESIKAGKAALDQMKKNKDEEAKITEQRAKTYLDLASSVGDSFQDLLLSQEASFGQFLKNTLVLALDALEKVLLMSMAETTMKDIAEKGFAGIATAAAKIVLMKAAFATAKAGILSIGGKKEKKGYAEGGFTEPGSKLEVAGVVHKGEYVIPQEGVENPKVKQVIDVIEMARQNNQLARLDIRPVYHTAPAKGFSGGGYTSAQLPSSASLNPMQGNLDVEKFNKAIDKLMKWEPAVAVETLERKRKQYNDMIDNSGL